MVHPCHDVASTFHANPSAQLAKGSDWMTREEARSLAAVMILIHSGRTSLFLKNVSGLDKMDGGKVLGMFLDLLRFMGGGAYDVSKFLLDSENLAVPHHRVRLYIVGRRRALIKDEVMRIRLLGREDIGAFLDPLSKQQPAETKELTPLARGNLNTTLKILKVRGAEPRDEDWIVDLDASERFRGCRKNASPCMLAFRHKGFWITSLGTKLNVDEACRLQGSRL